MSTFKSEVGLALDEAYPPSARPANWGDVLARAESIEVRTELSAQRSGIHRGSWRTRRILGSASVLALAAISGLFILDRWDRSVAFTDQALAAVGNGRFVDATFQREMPTLSLVDRRSGKQSAVIREIDWSYDTQTSRFRARVVDGGVAYAIRVAPPDPVITGFATSYRSALASGKAKVVGDRVIGGVPVRVLRLVVGNSDGSVALVEDVAVSLKTHEPVEVRYVSGPASDRRSITYRIRAIRSTDRSPVWTVRLSRRTRGAVARSVETSPRGAATTLGGHLVWLGTRFGRLSHVLVQTQWLTDAASSHAATSTRGVRLVYTGEDGLDLSIQEATTPQPAYGFFSAREGLDGAVPAVGKALLGCDCGGNTVYPPRVSTWRAQFRTTRLFLTVTSPSRQTLLAGIRALRSASP